MHVFTPQNTIRRQFAHIKQLKQTIDNKDKELTKVHQLNVQLQTRIRELERSLEDNQPATTKPLLQRDSHNSNQPPSLDLPWTKPKRTKSLKKQSGLKVGGQPGHPDATLLQVATPDRIIIQTANNCRQCRATLISSEPLRISRRQVFEIEYGSPAVVEHRALQKICPKCGITSKG